MFTLMPLPYAYKDLEPHIDAQTVEIHYSKHHQTYLNKLNEVLSGMDQYLNMDLVELLKNLHNLPTDKQNAVLNNAGQVYNHNIYWQTLSPNGGNEPSGLLAQQIQTTYGSFETFKQEFNNLGTTQFGSGWVWLSLDKSGNLVLDKTSNADSPLLHEKTPLMTMDVWEHAYYLKYQNRRIEYITAFWNLVNWSEISQKYDSLV